MTDIVERLRDGKTRSEEGPHYLCVEAADEIERLRHQCEGLAEAALSNGEDLLRHENEIERLREENERLRTALLGICRPVWSTPPIDSEAASVYARVCKEMIDIAEFAIASPTDHTAPGQADANPSQCPTSKTE